MKNLVRNFYSTLKGKEICLNKNTVLLKEETTLEINSDTIGFYAELQKNNFVVLFVNGNEHIVIAYEENVIDVENADIVLNSIDGKNSLVIDSKITITESFSSPVFTLGYSETEEDSNFLIWIKNILCSKERKILFKQHNLRYQ